MIRLLLLIALAFIGIANCHATIMMPVTVRGKMVVANGKLYFVQEPGSLTILDVRSGDVLGRYRFDGYLGGQIVPSVNNVAVTGYSKAYLIESRSGRVLFEADGLESRASEDHIAIQDAANRFTFIDRTTLESQVHEVQLNEKEQLVDFYINDQQLVLVVRDSIEWNRRVIVYDTVSRQVASSVSLHRDGQHYLIDDRLFLISPRHKAEATDAIADMSDFDLMDEEELLTTEDFVYTVASLDAIDAVEEMTAMRPLQSLLADSGGMDWFDGTSVVVDGVFLNDRQHAVKLPPDFGQQIARLRTSLDESVSGQQIEITGVGPFVSLSPDDDQRSFVTLRSANGWRRAFMKTNDRVTPYIWRLACDAATDSVVVNTGDGRIECLDLNSGKPKWLYTFAYSWGMVSTHGGYVGPYLDHEEERHQQRVAESRLLTGSVSVDMKITLEEFAARPLPDQSATTKIVRDPLPDVLYFDRMDRVRGVRKSLIWIVVLVIVVAVLFGIGGYRSESDKERLKISCTMCLFLAFGFYVVAVLLWNHHRIDSSLTLQMKLACGAMGAGIVGLALHAAWRKRFVVSLGMAVVLGLLLFVHWRPILYP